MEDVHIMCVSAATGQIPFFTELEAGVAASKIKSYRELTERLSQYGMPVSWEEILDNGGKSDQRRACAEEAYL